MHMAPLFAASPIFLGAAVLLAALLLAVNWMLYRHACAMTQFVRGGEPGPTTGWGKVRQVLFGCAIPRKVNRQSPADCGLPFENHEFFSGGERLSAWHIPNPWRRGMVLLFHGYQGCKAHVLAEAKAFHEMGYACFLIDFPGSGGSSGDVTTIGQREAQDVARTVNYVRDHWRNETLVLFGASMGSAAILRAMAMHRVEPDSVILECPFDRLVNAVATRCRMMGVPAFPTAWLLVFWGSVRLGLNGFQHNPVESARGVKCPVLLMHGTDDVKTTCAQVEAIYANLSGEKALHFFPGLGHESYVEKRPEEWKQQVRRFLLGQGEVVVLKAAS